LIGWRPDLLDEAGPGEAERIGAQHGLPPVSTDIPPSPLRLAAELPALLVIAALIAYTVKALVAQAFFIPSSSMVPQLQVDDRIVVSKLAYHLHNPRRGDIVVFDAPPHHQLHLPGPQRNFVAEGLHSLGEAVGVIQPSTSEFIKRVIGLPGETVEGRGGHVFIDGHLLVEPYLPNGTVTGDFGPATVPPGRLWVMGDNRGNSCDSRCFDKSQPPDPPTIPIGSVVGRTVLRLWPLSHASFL
jgi:signal peptidase I